MLYSHVFWFYCLQEFALKGSIEKFNSRYYQPDALPPPPTSMATTNNIMGGVGGVVSSENQASAANNQNSSEEEELVPLDLNYLSVLGKEVCVHICVCIKAWICMYLC